MSSPAKTIPFSPRSLTGELIHDATGLAAEPEETGRPDEKLVDLSTGDCHVDVDVVTIRMGLDQCFSDGRAPSRALSDTVVESVAWTAWIG